MSRKFFAILLFIFGFIIFIYGGVYARSVEPTTPFCILACPDITCEHGITCELDRVIDEDNDGHVGFNVTIFNNLDYPITNVFLGFGAEPYIKYEKGIESEGKLNIKTSDYYNYIDEGGNPMYGIAESFKLIYTDFYGETKAFQGTVASKIFDKAQEEKDETQEEEKDYKLKILLIFLASLIFIYLIISLLKKRKVFKKIKK